MNISDNGIDFIQDHEGCVLYAYQDAGGIWTIGYGHTGNVSDGDTITQDQADDLFQQDIQVYVNAVNNSIGSITTTQNQFDAMVSLSYNIGNEAFSQSTVLSDFSQGDIQGAANAFLMWNKVNGQFNAGLQQRREDEKQLFLS